jgi:hypothetical protein
MLHRPIGVVLAVLLLAACGKKDESLAKKAGAKVGETLTNFGHGVDAGIDRGRAVAVEVSDGLAARGVGATVSKRDGAAVSVYLTSKDAMDLQVVVKALDRGESEIGRAKAAVTFTRDDAKYVNLEFPREMDASLVAKYVVEEAR